MILYSIGTWDEDLQAYTPQEGLAMPSINVSWLGLLNALRRLRKTSYSCHRVRDANGEHDDNDWCVIVERTDGMDESRILENWKR
jgi:hypothetical protein